MDGSLHPARGSPGENTRDANPFRVYLFAKAVRDGAERMLGRDVLRDTALAVMPTLEL
jgi:hypothetical protein